MNFESSTNKDCQEHAKSLIRFGSTTNPITYLTRFIIQDPQIHPIVLVRFSYMGETQAFVSKSENPIWKSLWLNKLLHLICRICNFYLELCTLVQQGVCHTVALPFTLKSILRQKKNYGNSNISPCKNIIFQKSSKRNQNPSRYYNSITNLKFQHKPKISSFKNPYIKINPLPRGQNPSSSYTL